MHPRRHTHTPAGQHKPGSCQLFDTYTSSLCSLHCRAAPTSTAHGAATAWQAGRSRSGGQEAQAQAAAEIPERVSGVVVCHLVLYAHQRSALCLFNCADAAL